MSASLVGANPTDGTRGGVDMKKGGLIAVERELKWKVGEMELFIYLFNFHSVHPQSS